MSVAPHSTKFFLMSLWDKFLESISEEPLPANSIYQKDSKFAPISLANVDSHEMIASRRMEREETWGQTKGKAKVRSFCLFGL